MKVEVEIHEGSLFDVIRKCLNHYSDHSLIVLSNEIDRELQRRKDLING